MRLADGRELIYFDDTPGAQRRLDDPRDLPPATTLSEVRYDAVLDEWVTVASHRQGRTHLPPTDECPLCPSRDGRQTEIPSDDYDVVVFENRFPSLAGAGTPAGQPTPDTLFATSPGHGRCEVVCFTSDHDAAFASLPPAAGAHGDRGVDRPQRRSRRGARRGAGLLLREPRRGDRRHAAPPARPDLRLSLRHAAHPAHARVRAALPRRHRRQPVRRHARGRAAGRGAHRHPRRALDRVRAVRGPMAGRGAPLPNAHGPRPRRRSTTPSGTSSPSSTSTCSAGWTRSTTCRCPTSRRWHQAPVRTGRDLSYLHLQLFSIRRAPDKLKYLAGSESAMGAFINDVTPEQIAASLREAAADDHVVRRARRPFRGHLRPGPGRRLGRAGSGQPDRRARRLQRRARAAVRVDPAHLRRRRTARRRRGRGPRAARPTGRSPSRSRDSSRAVSPSGPPTSPACCGRCARTAMTCAGWMSCSTARCRSVPGCRRRRRWSAPWPSQQPSCPGCASTRRRWRRWRSGRRTTSSACRAG